VAASLAIHGLAALWLLFGQHMPAEPVRTGEVGVFIAALSTAEAVEAITPIKPAFARESKLPVRAAQHGKSGTSAAAVEQKAETPEEIDQAYSQALHEPAEVKTNQANVLVDEHLPTSSSRSSKDGEGNPHRIRHHLERYKFYPVSARRRGIEGAVQVGFQLDGKGYAEDVSVLASSGYSLLDRAARETVKRAEPFPATGGDFRFTLQFTKL